VSGSPPALVAVYRRRNQATMAQLADQAQTAGWKVGLWALDELAPELADVTVGVGPGLKFPLVNAMLEKLDAREGDLVVADDDVELSRGSLTDLLTIMRAGSLGICQPAHDQDSHVSHGITQARRATRARWTTYVEIGPIFAVHATWRSEVTPFPEEFGMGWGIELLWYDLQSSGCRLGVVDEVRIRHLSPPALEYDAHDESVRMLAMVRERGGTALGDLQRTRGRWWRGQRSPRWLSIPPTSAFGPRP
jgi:hypothetical protein